jgi:hypothetical protein
MRRRSREDFDNEVDREFPFDRQCPDCRALDPEIIEVDFGIGHYEYWGAPGFHTDYAFVTACCEAEPQEYMGPDPEEPNPDHINESEVA